MSQYFLIANLDKKQFIHPHNFKTEGHDHFSAKLQHICTEGIAGVLPFLLSTSGYFDYMGSWANDRLALIGDEAGPDEDLPRYDEVCQVYSEEAHGEWIDISGAVAKSYYDFLGE